MEIELDCLMVRTEDGLINWAVGAFELLPGRLPYTRYTVEYVASCIAAHATDRQEHYNVRLQRKWAASLTVRRILFGRKGWAYRLGYGLMRHSGVVVTFH